MSEHGGGSMGGVARVVLAMSGFAPAWLLLGLRLDRLSGPDIIPIGAAVCYAAAAVCCVLFGLLVGRLRRLRPVPIEIGRIDPGVMPVPQFAVLYLPVLLVGHPGSWVGLSQLAVVYAMIGAMLLRVDGFHLNPLFLLAGYRPCGITARDGRLYAAQIRGGVALRPGGTIHGVALGGTLICEL